MLLSFLYLFRPGSVFANYELKAGAVSFEQLANANKVTPQFLDSSYQLNPATYTAEITSKF